MSLRSFTQRENFMENSPRKQESVLMALIKGALLGLGISAIFAAGFWLRGTPFGSKLAPAPEGVSEVGNYPILTEVQNRLNTYYLRPQPDQKALEAGAIRGLLNTINDK